MKIYLQNVKDLLSLFGDSGNGKRSIIAYMAFAIIVLLVVVSKNRKLKQYFLYPSLVVIVFTLNPLTIRILIQSNLVDISRYVRLFWLIPIAFLFAYIGTVAAERTDQKWRKGMVSLVFLLAVVIGGTYMFTDGNYTVAENEYKLPDEVVKVTDFIVNDIGAQGKNINEIRIAAPPELSTYIRQYNGNIRMLYGRNWESSTPALEMMRLLSADEMDVNGIKTYASASEGAINYIILDETKKRNGSMEENGFELKGQIGKYLIYENLMLN